MVKNNEKYFGNCEVKMNVTDKSSIFESRNQHLVNKTTRLYW